MICDSFSREDFTFRELLPQVSAYASFNRQGDPQPGIVEVSQTKTVGLKATMPLYEGGATRSRVREAKFAAKRRAYQIDDIRRKIREDITRNWKAWLAAKSEAQSREAQIDAAQDARTGVREEARLGQRTVLDILDADQELIDARAGRAEAFYDEAIAYYALSGTLGFLTPQNLKLSAGKQISR
jgi:outer membrane protein